MPAGGAEVFRACTSNKGSFVGFTDSAFTPVRSKEAPPRELLRTALRRS